MVELVRVQILGECGLEAQASFIVWKAISNDGGYDLSKVMRTHMGSKIKRMFFIAKIIAIALGIVVVVVVLLRFYAHIG